MMHRWRTKRRYRVGYALADGNTYETKRRPFFRLTMAEKYAEWIQKDLERQYHTYAVFVTDLDNEERGDVRGTSEYE
jgi:hypothetical protein